MKVGKDKIIGLVLASIHLLVCVCFVLSGMWTIWRMNHPIPVLRKDAATLQSGSIVELEYEYAYEAWFESSVGYHVTRSFVALKLWDRDEYVYAVTDDSSNTFWKDKNYYSRPEKLKDFVAREPLTFVGKVYKIKEDWAESLARPMRRPEGDEFGVPNSTDNTNMDYYILFLNPYWERDTLTIRIMFTGFAAIIWGVFFLRYLQERKVIERIQRMKQLERHKKRVRDEMYRKTPWTQEEDT